MLMTAMRSSDSEDCSVEIERRRGLRIEQVCPVKVFEPVGARYIGGRTRNVSSTGLQIELPRWAYVREGKLISVHVGLSVVGEVLANRRAMIPARVVWVNRSSDSSGKYLVAGVEFLASLAARLDAA